MAGHILVIRVTGGRNAAATDSRIAVDAVDVRARFEEVSPSVTYTPAPGSAGRATATPTSSRRCS